jgi:hypothetical protein
MCQSRCGWTLNCPPVTTEIILLVLLSISPFFANSITRSSDENFPDQPNQCVALRANTDMKNFLLLYIPEFFENSLSPISSFSFRWNFHLFSNITGSSFQFLRSSYLSPKPSPNPIRNGSELLASFISFLLVRFLRPLPQFF